MPWLWIFVLGIIGIVLFNGGANFLLSGRTLALPIIWLVAVAAITGQNALAVGLVGGAVLAVGTLGLAIVQWRSNGSVPRQQIWWVAVVAAVATVAVGLTAFNGRVSVIESWALSVLGVASYWSVSRHGKRLVWWQWLVGLALCGTGGWLAVWAMPTIGAVCGLSPLVAGTLLAPCCLSSTAVWWWRQRKSTPPVILSQAVVSMLTGLLTVGVGLIGVIGGAFTVGATTRWLTWPWVALVLIVGLVPLLWRQKTTRVGGGLLVSSYLIYWLLLSI